MLKGLLILLKDICVYFFPKSIIRIFFKEIDFIFLVHPLNLRDVIKKYGFSKFFPESFIDIWLRMFIPVFCSSVVGFKSEGGRNVKGYIMACPLTPRQMLKQPMLARKKIMNSVQLADKLGSKIIGLGGFTSILTHDGLDLINSSKINITTGNAFSAGLIILNIKKITETMNVQLQDITVAIIGAAGSVGFGASQLISKLVKKIILIDINMQELQRLSRFIQKDNKEITDDIKASYKANVIVTVTNVPGTILKAEDLPGGIIIIDAAQPKNVSGDIPKKRRDILVIDSGIAEVNDISYNFNLGLKKNEVYSCFAELLIASWKETEQLPYNRNDYIGKTKPEVIEKLLYCANIIGIRLAKFRNTNGFLENEHILNFKANFINKM